MQIGRREDISFLLFINLLESVDLIVAGGVSHVLFSSLPSSVILFIVMALLLRTGTFHIL